MRAVWSGAIPKELASSARPHVLRYLPSLPCWVARLDIEFDTSPADENETVYLTVSAQEEMRTATLNLRADWLQLDDTQRDELMSHEFAHVAGLPAFDMVAAILADVEAPKILRDQFEARVEAATQDYAKVFRKAYGR